MTNKLSDNALAIYKKLYLSSVLGESSPSQTHARVAAFAASAEPAGERKGVEAAFFEMMEKNQFRPNTPTMLNAGLQTQPQTSACFVGDLQDDMYSILDFDRDAAIIYKSGSGIGGNYGMLRETNAPLSTGGKSSGPFAFLRKGAMTAHAVKSGGSSRRAAHMAMMTDTHPDLLKFITIKAESDEFVILPDGQKTPLFSAMNLSVAISDKFMEAVRADDKWDLLGVVDKQVKDTLPAKWLFRQIHEAAWKNGDPGVWFIDRANEDNTVPSFGRIVTTNPCGEQSLLPRQACGLGSINVAAFVKDGIFDWDSFQNTVRLATRFLDNCIDLSGYPTPAYEQMARNTRPIGLGIMGLADAFIMMGMKYDSKKAQLFAETLAKTLTSTSIAESTFLAFSKRAFPLFAENREAVINVASKFVDDDTLEKIKAYGIRNSQWTTIAPTGTTSISCDCSQGMEPLFAICYDKTLSDSGEVWTFVNPIFEKCYSKCSWYPEAIKKIAENHGSVVGLDLPQEADIFVTAHDIDWKARIDMQAALQRGISNAISSTINLPNSATPDDIAQIYMYAWEKGLKGITVYRDGSKANQPVSFGSKAKPKPEPEMTIPVSRPKIRKGLTHEVKTGHGTVYFTVNCDEANQPMELFTNGGKNGSVNAANLEAMARLISIALQEGVSPERLARTIENINDGTIAWDRLDEADEKAIPIISIPDAMGKILRRFYCSIPDSSVNKASNLESSKPIHRCETCNSPTYMHDGCEFCPQCGSKCG